MSTRELLLYMAVVGPFAIGMVIAVSAGEPLLLVAGLIPAFIWGRIEEYRERHCRHRHRAPG